MRLGFAVTVLGKPDLKAYDTRRWPDHPHLSVSLAYVRDIFYYLDQHDIRMYRLAPTLAPYLTHPDRPQFHNQIDECRRELRAIGDLARSLDLRLSFHAPPYVQLSTPDEALVQRSINELDGLSRLLDAMELDDNAVVVVHIGGAYEDPQAALDRFSSHYEALPPHIRRRLVVENDDHSFHPGHTYTLHQRHGVRVIYDHLHALINPSPSHPWQTALSQALQTWPPEQTPKIHFSSPRTAIRVIRGAKSTTSPRRKHLLPPDPAQHADFIDPFAFIHFLQATQHMRPFDVMLEAKARDLALLRLREQLARFAPSDIRSGGKR